MRQLSKYTRMHVELKDYLMQCVCEAGRTGTPVMRPVFYHYDEEWAYREKTEYLLGRDILVAPVYKEGEVKRECYLPKDTWVHLFSGKEYSGGKVEVAAPIGEPPVFIRKDSNYFNELMDIAKV